MQHVTEPHVAPADQVSVSVQEPRRPVPLAVEGAPAGRGPARLPDRRYRRLLATADVASALLALLVFVVLLGRRDALTAGAVVGVPLTVVAGKLLGLYDRDELLLNKTTLDEAPNLFQLATLSTLLLWLGHDVLVQGQLGRTQLLAFWLGLFVLLLGLRWAARHVARLTTRPEQVVLVGEPSTCDQVRARIDGSSTVHSQVVAQIDLEAATDAENAAAGLVHVSADQEVDRVVIASPASDHGDVLNLIRAAKALTLKVSVLPRMLEVVGSSAEHDDLHGLNLLGIRRFGLTRSSWLVKRGMDVTVSMIGLVLTAPLFALVACAIKLDSSGAVFFRQERVGHRGRVFRMLKFRTMDANAEERKQELAGFNQADGLFKIANDPRITRIGRLLRRTALDELPQLVNVLRGQMSLVGPRPLVLEDDRRVEGWYRRRLDLTPGMTGCWQVLGSARIPLHEMVKLDYLYIANWSLWGDVKILLRTLLFVLRGRGL